MTANDDGITRRTLLSVGGLGVGVLGVATGSLAVLGDDRVEYTRRTLAQTDDGSGSLLVDWAAWYNGASTGTSQATPTNSDGMPLIALENVLPGDSGKLAFGLTLDEESTATEAEVRMRLRLFPEQTGDNGQTEAELAAGDDASDVGELQNVIEVDAWYDGGFTVDETPLYGHCDGAFDGTFESRFVDDTLGNAVVTTDTWDPAETGVAVLDCLPRGDGLCVALEWSLPRDLPVPDNVVQSDRVAFEVAFAVFDCGP